MKFPAAIAAPAMWAIAALLAAAPALAGCESYREVELQEPDGMKPGPGLFSGSDGVFTIYSKDGADEGEGSDDNDE